MDVSYPAFRALKHLGLTDLPISIGAPAAFTEKEAVSVSLAFFHIYIIWFYRQEIYLEECDKNAQVSSVFQISSGE